MISTTITSRAAGTHGLRISPARVAHAEWIKLRSLRSTIWTIAASAAAIIGTGVLLCIVARGHMAASERHHQAIDPIRVTLFGMYLGQLTIGLLGVLLA